MTFEEKIDMQEPEPILLHFANADPNNIVVNIDKRISQANSSNYIYVPTLQLAVNICNGLLINSRCVLLYSPENVLHALKELHELPNLGQLFVLTRQMPNLVREYLRVRGFAVVAYSRYMRFTRRKDRKVIVLMDE